MSDIQIPGFEVLGKLGAGGMATVWKARQVSLDRVVAIKILSSRLAKDPAEISQFQQEAQAAAKLKHPGIVQVYDAYAGQGLYYFVMEYVAGYTVGEWIRRKGVLAESDALLVAECVADALEYAWDRARIIHCDIKPDNVMIDADGTVKVADLGLARTITALSAQGLSDQITGTPAYISPEQASGELNLDCRTDIYALGAMLYQELTGKLLFAGQPDEKVLESQIADTVEDPAVLNPKLSSAVCWMIEKMLAKSREHRYANWSEVRTDLARVKNGQMPKAKLVPAGASTVRRSALRAKALVIQASPGGSLAAKRTAGQPRGSVTGSLVRLFILGALAAAGVAGFFYAKDKGLLPGSVPPPPTMPPVPPAGAPAPQRDDSPPASAPAPAPVPSSQPTAAPVVTPAEAALQSAKSWIAEHPQDFDEGVRRLLAVESSTRGTSVEAAAREEIERVESERRRQEGETQRAAIEDAWRALQRDLAPLVAGRDFAGAARKLREYSGPMASELASWCAQLAGDMDRRQTAFEAEKAQAEEMSKQQRDRLLDRVARTLLTEGLNQGLGVLDGELSASQALGATAELTEVRDLLRAVGRLDERILASFQAQIGQEITIQTTAGAKTFVVGGVAEGRIFGEQRFAAGGATASRPVSFGVSDMASKERIARMGADAQPEVALAKGMMAVESKAFDFARRYFATTHPSLAPRLAAEVEEQERAQKETEAEAALLAIGRSLGITTALDVPAWQKALATKRLSSGDAAALAKQLDLFAERYGDTRFARDRAHGLLLRLKQMCQRSGREPLPGGFHRIGPRGEGDDSPSRHPLVQKLLARNPRLGLGDIRVATDEAGTVLGVEIPAACVDDLAPLGEIKELRELRFSVPRDAARPRKDAIGGLRDLSAIRGLMLEKLYAAGTDLRDLGPLSGMPLVELDVSDTAVSDLGPVRSAPLRFLSVRGSKVRDLMPLKGAPMVELDICGTPVFDFAPLAVLPLRVLRASDTQFKDLSVLKSAPLERLEIANTRVHNFQPLAEMAALAYLDVAGTQIKDLAPLLNVPLTGLRVDATGITDLTLLRDKPLSSLSIAQTALKDFEPIRGMPLTFLDASGTRLRDLAVLSAMPLRSLSIANTPVEDLGPIEKMELTALTISGSQVKELRPIAKMPLDDLACVGIPAKDFGVLRGMPIKRLWIDAAHGSKNFFREMPDLQTVNGMPFARW